MTTETAGTSPDDRATEIAANPDAAPTIVADSPNPSTLPAPAAAPAPEAATPEPQPEPETRQSKRDAIAERFKAMRAASEGEPSDTVTTTPMGEFVPPFVAKANAKAEADAAAAAEEEARKAATPEPAAAPRPTRSRSVGTTSPWPPATSC